MENVVFGDDQSETSSNVGNRSRSRPSMIDLILSRYRQYQVSTSVITFVTTLSDRCAVPFPLKILLLPLLIHRLAIFVSLCVVSSHALHCRDGSVLFCSSYPVYPPLSGRPPQLPLYTIETKLRDEGNLFAGYRAFSEHAPNRQTLDGRIVQAGRQVGRMYVRPLDGSCCIRK